MKESILTGEFRLTGECVKSNIPSLPGKRSNNSGALIAGVTRLSSDKTINPVLKIVDKTKQSNLKMRELVDIVIILLCSSHCGADYHHIRHMERGYYGSVRQDSIRAVVQTIPYAITALIVSCPRATELAVALVVAIVGA